VNEIEATDKYWNDLLFNITEGNASEMLALKRFDIFEFFAYVDNKMKHGGD